MAKEDDDLELLFRYRKRVTEDPLRLEILAAHALIEEMIELVIAEAVPNSECFEVPKMQFWKKLKIIRALDPSEKHALVWKFIVKLSELRNVAAHKDYEKFRDERFKDLAEFFYPDPAVRAVHGWDTLLEEGTEFCAGFLMGMRDRFRHLRQGS
jgi:hypothetical protein